MSAKIDVDVARPPGLPTEWPSPEDRPLRGGEANAWMLYELSSGVTVSHEVQWSQRGGTSRFQMEIYGTEGSILVCVPRTGENLAISVLQEPGTHNRKVDWIVPELPGRPMGQAQHEALLQDIREGRADPPGIAGMAVLKVCYAAREAASTGSWVDVA